MGEEIMENYRQYLRGKYRKAHTQENYYRFVSDFQGWLEEKGKSIEELAPQDTQDYKIYCTENYSLNGNVGRMNALNNFVGKFLGKKELLVRAPDSEASNKQVLSKDELDRYVAAAETPLEKLVVSLQVDGLLRPGEICELKESNVDFENRKLYLDDTKTGNNYIIMSRHLMDRMTEYREHRTEPKREEDKDRLIILDRGNRTGLPPTSHRPDFVYNLTKRLAVKAKIRRSVYPYLIKPSVITRYFDENVNPKTIQRMARHKYIDTTLRYDHTDDTTVRDFLDRRHGEPTEGRGEDDDLKQTAEILQRLIDGEIDVKELAKEIKSTKRKEHKDDVAYL
ncbi:MAG: site-specific integrase [Candidatus Thermoplasmatota archaeon]|nr:site-specific integrase [Candidatus Thermoplasmatota archaeon]